MDKYLFLLATLCFNITGGYFAKLASWITEGPAYSYMILAITCYGLGFIFYIMALKHVPLFVVQSLLASQYVIMILLSFFVFKEVISTTQGAGIMLILIGVFLVLAK